MSNPTNTTEPNKRSESILARAKYRAELREHIDNLTIEHGQNRPALALAVVQDALAAIVDPAKGFPAPDGGEISMQDFIPIISAEMETVLSGVPPYSHAAVADRFIAAWRERLLHVAKWGWLEWTDQYWKHHETTGAYSKVHAICREVSGEARSMGVSKEAMDIATSGFAAAVERIAAARMPAAIDQWDADIEALNTPGGLVDLRTGTLRENRRNDFCTKRTAVAPAEYEDCPLWLDFLSTVTNGDRDLESYLKRMVGYSLTGLTIEQALFFLYGTGANGKGVFLNTLGRILDSYAVSAGTEIFMVSSNDRHPTELARLRGARFVTANETEEGRRWAESRIKQLTGGDPVTARFMRKDFFDYRPQFKLVIAGNHKPSLRTVDEAIRRRFHLVPFSVTIPPASRDPHLEEKLRAEWPAILRWAINGCVDWQKERLSPPSVVTDATGQYLESEDAMGQWLEECCARDPQGRELSSDLFRKWKEWAEAAEEFIGSQKTFSQKLEDRGFKRARDGAGRSEFRGIRLF